MKAKLNNQIISALNQGEVIHLKEIQKMPNNQEVPNLLINNNNSYISRKAQITSIILIIKKILVKMETKIMLSLQPTKMKINLKIIKKIALKNN